MPHYSLMCACAGQLIRPPLSIQFGCIDQNNGTSLANELRDKWLSYMDPECGTMEQGSI